MVKKNKEKDIKDKDTKEQDIKEQLEQAQQSAKDNWDKLLRAQAEIENLKRRHAKDIESAHKFVLDKFVKSLLEVKDSLNMGMKSATEKTATVESIFDGLKIIDKVFTSTLKKFNVVEINPKDEIFDPALHEAVTIVEAPNKKPNSILEVVQIGFTLNERLIRPAMVIVAK